jgi:hypothetical protein
MTRCSHLVLAVFVRAPPRVDQVRFLFVLFHIVLLVKLGQRLLQLLVSSHGGRGGCGGYVKRSSRARTRRQQVFDRLLGDSFN